jgi:fructose-1,6-bisphosphatase-3
MTTFERRLIKDESAWTEPKNSYYTLYNDSAVCEMILKEFGLEGPHCHIINGHIPVKTIKGESPIKAGGKLMVIDGGFSKAYQSETGIAGYTLIFNSYGLHLVQHQPFISRQKAIEDGLDIISSNHVVDMASKRMYVRDTDTGRELAEQISDLKELLKAYRGGLIREEA